VPETTAGYLAAIAYERAEMVNWLPKLMPVAHERAAGVFEGTCQGTAVMTGKSEALRDTLDELHEQLESVEAGDSEVQALLQGAIEDLRAALDASTEDVSAESEQETFVDRFEEAATHFEESYPVLAGTLRKLAEVLSQMGI